MLPGDLAGRNPSAHLACGVSFGRATDLPWGRLQLATVKCCWQMGKEGNEKAPCATLLSQAPVSMGTSSPGRAGVTL